MLAPIFKTILRENIIFMFCTPPPPTASPQKEASKSWYFPKATHLVRDGPGICPQTGLTLQPEALSSWPWCLIHVNNYNTSQKEISSMRGTDKRSWEFKGGRSGLWKREQESLVTRWFCFSGPVPLTTQGRVGEGGFGQLEVGCETPGVLKSNPRGLRVLAHALWLRAERQQQDDFKFNTEKASSCNREYFLLVSSPNSDYYLKTKAHICIY